MNWRREEIRLEMIVHQYNIILSHVYLQSQLLAADSTSAATMNIQKRSKKHCLGSTDIIFVSEVGFPADAQLLKTDQNSRIHLFNRKPIHLALWTIF